MWNKYWLTVVIALSGWPVEARYSFDSSLINVSDDINFSLFEQGVQPPGVYPVDIILNNKIVDTRSLEFSIGNDSEGKPALQACLDRDMLVNYGVKVEDYPKLFHSKTKAPTGEGMQQTCADLSAIPQAFVYHKFYDQQLVLSIPQIALRPALTGIAPEASWNDGIPAFLINYRLMANRNEFRSDGKGTSDSSLFAQLEPGANAGAWRLRNAMTWQKSGDWQRRYSYAERGIYSWKSRLTLGETNTSSDIFDSIPFSGGMLATDEAMLPFQLRSFSPVVRGIARSQARIEVKQNEYVVYETTVSPGPFALNDLVTRGGSDLEVRVYETDGTVQYFVVPNNEPAIALRQGYLKYSLATGWYRSATPTITSSPLGLMTLMAGLPWDVTSYGGLQWSNHYQAASTGVGKSMGYLGAMSADGTFSQGKMYGLRNQNGYKWRIRYNKSIDTTNTGIYVSAIRHSSTGFHSMSTVLDSYKNEHKYSLSESNDVQRTKNKNSLNVSLSQPLASLGSVYLSGRWETFWHIPQTQRTLMLSYNTYIRNVSLSVNLSQNQVQHSNSKSGALKSEQQLSLSVHIPLSQSLSMSYQTQNGTGRTSSHNIRLDGHNVDHRLNWHVDHSMTSGRHNNDRSSVRTSWLEGNELTGGYSYSPTSRQTNVGISGGGVIHQHGLTLGPFLGGTNGLVETPGVAGVSIGNRAGMTTDYNGYTILNDMSPYQVNSVSLDPNTLPANAEIPQTDLKVIPTAGAIIPVKYKTNVGARGTMSIVRPDGSQVPFGAVVTPVDSSAINSGSGITDEEGNVYLTGLQDKGRLLVRWGKSKSQKCYIDYHLPDNSDAFIYEMKGVCRQDK